VRRADGDGPLAARSLAKAARVFVPKGQPFTDDHIGAAMMAANRPGPPAEPPWIVSRLSGARRGPSTSRIPKNV
jgi:hypothetical protein